MAGRHFGAVVRRIERIFVAGTVAGLSEGELLERFATRGDEAAFEAILARHGPMVLGICRQVLHDPNDVEDAFQATFLVLVRKAGSLRRRDLLGNWLFGVASRVALRARSVAARRRTIEGPGVAMDSPAIGHEGDFDRESRTMLHEEVRQLPQKYRIPILLCYLEGLTHEEAARQLGWPLGTVKGRLARAREMLHKRLTRRGVNLSASALSAAVARQAEATVPAALVQSTIKAALAVAAGRTLAAGVVAANVAALTKGVSDAMFLNTIKLAVMVLVAGVITTGAGVVAFQGEGGPVGGAAPPSTNRPTVQSVSVDVPQLLDAAQRMFDSQWAAYAKGRIAVDRIADASRRWLEAELSTSSGPADRAAAYRAHLKRMEKLQAYEYSALPKHQGMDENFTAARFLRLQAEKMLADEIGPASWGPPVTTNPGPPPTVPVPVAPAPRSPSGLRANPFDSTNRVEIAKLASRNAARDRSKGDQAIVKALEENITLSFVEKTPLEEVLRHIKAKTRGAEGESVSRAITIYIDPVALEEQNLDPKTTLVTINLEGVPLRTSLRLLLKQLNLAYCVRDGMVIISSVDGVLEELKEAEANEEAAVTPDPGVAAEAQTSPPVLPAQPPLETPAEKAADRTPGGQTPQGPQTPAPGAANANNAGAAVSAKLQKTLDVPVKLSITRETPLRDVFKSLNQMVEARDGSAIPFYIDPSVDARAISSEFDVEGIPLRTVLSLLLSQVGLQWDVLDNLLIVSDAERLQNYRQIAAHLTVPGTSYGDGMMPRSPSPELLATFAAPVTLTFPKPTPLNEAMTSIRDATKGAGGSGISLFYGPPVSIQTEASFAPRPVGVPSELEQKKIGSLPVQINLKDVPLRTCLALLLGQRAPSIVNKANGVAFYTWPPLDGRVIDDVLIIGERNWVQSIQLPQGGFSGGMGQGMRPAGGAGMM